MNHEDTRATRGYFHNNPSVKKPKPSFPLIHVTEIGEHVRMEGELTSRETLLIQGEYSGDLRCSSHLTIGPKGRAANLRVVTKNLTVFGSLAGEIKARGFVEIKDRAKVVASIETGSLIVSDSASFEGSVRMPGIGD
jgi:cytoskeletal protein CcmA (bactofilin family)